MVVKKTIRHSNVFFYNHLYRNSVFRNIIMESGIKIVLPLGYATINHPLIASRIFLHQLPEYHQLLNILRAFAQ